MSKTIAELLKEKIIEAIDRANLTAEQYRMLIDAYTEIVLLRQKYEPKLKQFKEMEESLKVSGGRPISKS